MREMSVWEAYAVVQGYNDAHGGEDPGLSTTEADELWLWLQEKDGLVH